jgi:hypothetical protein
MVFLDKDASRGHCDKDDEVFYTKEQPHTEPRQIAPSDGQHAPHDWLNGALDLLS